MNKNSFLEALRNIFKKARVADVESIIEVYEEHFAVGYERGLTDSEIIKSLGTPEEIYASYVDAGIITDTLGQDGGEVNLLICKQSMQDLMIIKNVYYHNYQVWLKKHPKHCYLLEVLCHIS